MRATIDDQVVDGGLQVCFRSLGEIGPEQVAKRLAKPWCDAFPVGVRLAWLEVSGFDDASREGGSE